MEKNLEIFSAMQEGKPYRVFKKTVLSKVVVNVINPFTGEVESEVMYGNPAKNDEGCFLEVWDVQGYQFVKNMNKGHFNKGYLIEVKKKAERVITDVEKLHQASDEELEEILNTPWFGFQAAINKMESEAPLTRLLEMARKQEKSEKYTQFIEARIAEVQSLDK